MNRKAENTIIKRVAVQFGKSEKEIRNEICYAIDVAYENRDTHSKWVEIFGEKKPTPEEFIAVIANYLVSGSRDNQGSILLNV